MKKVSTHPEFRIINIRFQEEELVRFKEIAKSKGLPMAALIRIAAKIGLDQIEEDQNAISKSISSR